MHDVMICLLLNEHTEEAVNFYTAVFEDSNIKSVQRYGANMPVAEGSVLSIEFTIKGQNFIGLNGPPTTFTDAVSIMIKAETQEQIDRYYDALAGNGGTAMPCGWVKDRFGVVWQIYWPDMIRFFSAKDTAASQRAIQAMMTMYKLDIAKLQAAYNGE